MQSIARLFRITQEAMVEDIRVNMDLAGHKVAQELVFNIKEIMAMGNILARAINIITKGDFKVIPSS